MATIHRINRRDAADQQRSLAAQALNAALADVLWSDPDQPDCHLIDELAAWLRAEQRGQGKAATARAEALAVRLRHLALSGETTAEATAAVKRQLREMADRAGGAA